MSNTTTESSSTNKVKLHPVIVDLLSKRGLSEEEISDFLSWDLKSLPELTSLIDIEKTSDRIIEALSKNETIGIYGDYDVDGTTSCALFYHFFKLLGHSVKLIQPSRFIEGYGIHPPSVEKAKAEGISLLITVDCGITNSEAADYAKEIGLDLIITDHHKDACETMPDAYAIVNPNRRDEPQDSPLRTLAGVGVAFAVCLQVKKDLEKTGRKIASIYDLLQFVAIGTICDLAKLNTLNLRLVRHGLKQIPTTTYPGIKAFFTPEERERGFVPSEKLSFHVGPYINSKGRLDHPEKALNLLISDSYDSARENYEHLEISNNERKFIQAEVFNEAKEQVLKEITSPEHLISIVYAPHWHEGVIGIVASKLVENFKVPAIVFSDSEQEGIIKASARSAGDLDLFSLLKDCSSFFQKFGGHKAAAGLSMSKENYADFKNKITGLLREIPEGNRTKIDSFDLEISAKDISYQLIKSLELLEPFGMANEKPLFVARDFTLESYKILKDVHVKWNFKAKNGNQNVGGISFNFVNKWGTIDPEEIYKLSKEGMENMNVFFTLGINRFNGKEYIQLMVEKISFGLI